jgi:hypothetical protein
VDIEEQGLRRRSGNGTGNRHPAQLDMAGDHLDRDSGAGCRCGHLGGGDVAVGGRVHLVARRQVQPQLEAAHAALGLLRHLRVDDATRGRHPLHVAGPQVAAIASAVLVAHPAVEHVGDRLEAAVRMGREPGEVIVRVVGEELVEHQERVVAQVVGAAEATAQLDAGAV